MLSEQSIPWKTGILAPTTSKSADVTEATFEADSGVGTDGVAGQRAEHQAAEGCPTPVQPETGAATASCGSGVERQSVIRNEQRRVMA